MSDVQLSVNGCLSGHTLSGSNSLLEASGGRRVCALMALSRHSRQRRRGLLRRGRDRAGAVTGHEGVMVPAKLGRLMVSSPGLETTVADGLRVLHRCTFPELRASSKYSPITAARTPASCAAVAASGSAPLSCAASSMAQSSSAIASASDGAGASSSAQPAARAAYATCPA
eukprot:CAMPEP_0119424308 /NCGR_PEP_ID=MMETSP1335-20130426/32272_1 /TAXON_ID=259385 /ORGANISM="Chrysoculter rhomboideus, Strain RCC1486" /LENGTH=170 /DNA_ID=CAMNT_0007449827 /DNA_START=73 /DNA_END=581 /DNA_ORIENTATION=+